MKGIGKILFPEQYDEVGEEVIVSDSQEARMFFEEAYPKGGIVALGTLHLNSLEIPELNAWIYCNIVNKEMTLRALCPIFASDMEKIGNLQILKIIPHQSEMFMHWNHTLYSSVFTSEGEIVIKKVKLLLDASEAKQVFDMYSPNPVTDIYPVEIYSYSERRFIGVCWETLHEDDDYSYWHPVCLADEVKLSTYSMEDLVDYPIKVGETAVIDGDTYILKYTKEDGFYFRLLAIKKDGNTVKVRFDNVVTDPKHKKKPKDDTKHIILPFKPNSR